MKNSFIKRLLTMPLAVCLAAFICAPSAGAQDVYFSFTDPSALVGETVSVTIQSSAPVGGVSMTVVYDAEALSYTGYSGGMGNLSVKQSGGSISLTDFDSNSESYFAVTFNFKALKNGTTKITTSSGSASDAGGDLLDAGFGNSTISVTAASADATLSSLYIDPGVLSPSFSPSVHEYTATVENSSTYITVAANPADAYATAYVDGHASLKEGQNKVTVTVTAGNGAQSVYTIVVTRKSLSGASDTTSVQSTAAASQTQNSETDSAIPSGGATVTLTDGTSLTITSYGEEDIPSGYMAATIRYQNTDIPAVISEDGLHLAVYLQGDKDHPTAFYYFDEDSGTARAMDAVTVPAMTCSILDASGYEETPPEGCTIGTYKFDGEPYRVFLPEDSSADYIVLYGEMNGEKGLYQYDTVQKTLQRYGLAVLEKEPEPEAEPDTEQEEADAQLQQAQSELASAQKAAARYRTVAIVVSVIAIVMLLAASVLAFLYLRRYHRDQNSEWP